jgi:hypothetical protein
VAAEEAVHVKTKDQADLEVQEAEDLGELVIQEQLEE